jgi:hypothetical protein
VGRSNRNVPASCGALALVGLAALAPLRPARAAETQWWVVDSAGDLSKAEARGIVVDPEGVMSLGPELRSWNADTLSVIWAIARLADGAIAVAGDRGRVDRWTEKDGLKPWVRLPVGQVLSLAAAGDGVLAGTGPEGAIYRVSARGDTALVLRTGERYVWGLAPAGGGDWYAATGTRGRLLRVAAGKARVVLDTDESNLVSILADGHGGVYAGGDSKGRVFHLAAGGAARTLFDAGEDEIRGLAIGRDGALYAAALSASAVGGDDDGERPEPVKSSVANARSTVYRIVPDSSVEAWWTSAQPMVFALAGGPEGLVAATGNRAALYRIDRMNGATQLVALPQGQVTALAVEPSGALIAATSNPGALWRVGPERAKRGELISPALDARRIAQFGRVRWHGRGAATVRIETRSGNCDPPDTTWTAWSGGDVGDDGAPSESPPARYLQWKLVLHEAGVRVSSIEAAWRERNLAPRVEDLVVAPQGQGFREGELAPRVESVTQSLPGGQKVEYTAPSGTTPKALRDLPMWAQGLRTLQWRGSDPNGDPLEYRVDVRAAGHEQWIEIGKDLTSSSFTWDTRGLPDGRYRVRVTATDRPGNAVGEERTGEAVSEEFIIDNTPPRIEHFEAKADRDGVAFSGEAADDANIVTRVEVSLDDDEWRVVAPDGGLADARRVRFHGRWPDVKPGAHTFSVRAVDGGGNPVVSATHLMIAPTR